MRGKWRKSSKFGAMKSVSGHSRIKDSKFKYQAKLSKIRGNGELIEMVLKDD